MSQTASDIASIVTTYGLAALVFVTAQELSTFAALGAVVLVLVRILHECFKLYVRVQEYQKERRNGRE